MALRDALLVALSLGLPMVALASGFEPATDQQLAACLVRPQGTPAYPAGDVERKSGALVRVNIEFALLDAAPDVEVFFNSGSPAFAQAVKDYVGAYRLSCMAKGAVPVKMAQEFRFRPGDGQPVTFAQARLSGSGEPCISVGNGVPSYPKLGPLWARDLAPQGTVLAEVGFVGVGLPPTVRILFDGGHPKLGLSVANHIVAQYRATCAPALGFPLVGVQSFAFKIDGDAGYRMNDVGLRAFVGALKNLESGGPIFDFDTMACPFDIQLSHLRPYALNFATEVGVADPNRREFIEWLRQATLKLPADAAKQLVGASLKISVPCGKLDLS